VSERTDRAIAALLAARDVEFDPPPFDAAAATALGPAFAPGTPHRKLLEAANGAYLFGRALHLLGACERPDWHSLCAWNDARTWRDAYDNIAEELIFFAEDAFGDQFAYSGRGGEVVLFEAELGRAGPCAPTFVDWLELVVEQRDALLPIDLLAAHAGEGKRLQPGTQLFAYPPLFSLESKEGVEVGHVDAVEAMRFRGQLARQIRGLPSGTRVKIEVE
jgi:SMI1 / KNR4 family (SUKH-1)